MAYKDFEDLTQDTITTDSPVTIIGAEGEIIDLPDVSFVKDADIQRDGMDLVLEGPQGTIIIEGYFAAEPAPQLSAPSGERLTPDLVESFVHSPQQYASNSSMNDESPVGSVQELSGEAFVTRVDGTQEPLSLGKEIFQGDVITTQEGGAVNIVFEDNTSFAISEDSKLAIDEYVYDPATESGTSNFSVLKGLFVFTSGLIGRDDPDDVMIDTPSGSIGIRGTIIMGDVDKGEITVVEGAIVLRGFDGSEMTLANQFETAKFNPAGGSIDMMGQLSPNDVMSKFSGVSRVAGDLFSSINDVANEGNSENGNEAQPGDNEAGAENNDVEANAEEGNPDADGIANQAPQNLRGDGDLSPEDRAGIDGPEGPDLEAGEALEAELRELIENGEISPEEAQEIFDQEMGENPEGNRNINDPASAEAFDEALLHEGMHNDHLLGGDGFGDTSGFGPNGFGGDAFGDHFGPQGPGGADAPDGNGDPSAADGPDNQPNGDGNDSGGAGNTIPPFELRFIDNPNLAEFDTFIGKIVSINDVPILGFNFDGPDVSLLNFQLTPDGKEILVFSNAPINFNTHPVLDLGNFTATSVNGQFFSENVGSFSVDNVYTSAPTQTGTPHAASILTSDNITYEMDVGKFFVDSEIPEGDMLSFFLSGSSLTTLQGMSSDIVNANIDLTTGEIFGPSLEIEFADLASDTPINLDIFAQDLDGNVSGSPLSIALQIFDGTSYSVPITGGGKFYGTDISDNMFLNGAGTADIFSGKGSDTISLTGASGNRIVTGSSIGGTDSVNLVSSSSQNDIIGGLDNDLFNIDTSSIDNEIHAEGGLLDTLITQHAQNRYFGGAGDDIVEFDISFGNILAQLDGMTASNSDGNGKYSGGEGPDGFDILIFDNQAGGTFGAQTIDFSKFDNAMFEGFEEIKLDGADTDTLIMNFDDIFNMLDSGNDEFHIKLGTGDSFQFDDSNNASMVINGVAQGSGPSLNANLGGAANVISDGTNTITVFIDAASAGQTSII